MNYHFAFCTIVFLIFFLDINATYGYIFTEKSIIKASCDGGNSRSLCKRLCLQRLYGINKGLFDVNKASANQVAKKVSSLPYFLYNNDDKIRNVNSNLIRTNAAISREVSDVRNYAYEDQDAGPPPDLPSLLLHNRIVYVGMTLVPAVTELIIGQLLFLDSQSVGEDEPIYMYINSPGTQAIDGSAVVYDTEAFAISDVMHYVKSPISTIAVGHCFGAAAMLLASGTKGLRYSMPNTSIRLSLPKTFASGQASDIAIKAKEVLANRKTICNIIARACGKRMEEVEKDANRRVYFSPEEALEYGLIDKILTSPDDLPKLSPS